MIGHTPVIFDNSLVYTSNLYSSLPTYGTDNALLYDGVERVEAG